MGVADASDATAKTRKDKSGGIPASMSMSIKYLYSANNRRSNLRRSLRTLRSLRCVGWKRGFSEDPGEQWLQVAAGLLGGRSLRCSLYQPCANGH